MSYQRQWSRWDQKIVSKLIYSFIHNSSAKWIFEAC
jgi:hypothetical protein